MAQVVFSFLGVCTYFPTFREYDPSPTAPAHRMLLVNGGPEALKKIPTSGVDPHTAKIQMFRSQIISIDGGPAAFPRSETEGDSYEFSLSDDFGMKIWVEDVSGPYEEFNIANLPGLQDHLSTPRPIPPPNSFVFDEDPKGASVYVDFDSGTISAFLLPVLDSEMGITQLVITTPDDEVLVKFRQFQSGNEWTVRLRDSGTALLPPDTPGGVTVSNMVTAGLTENPKDFYLQYLAVQPPFPPLANIKFVNEQLVLPLSPFSYGIPSNAISNQDADPGCSNSHYP
jgi:hypothetical protein